MQKMKGQADYWLQQWHKAEKEGNEAAAEKFKENYENTISSLQSVIEESAQTILDKYSNTIEKLF
jgi:hypothetical protein